MVENHTSVKRVFGLDVMRSAAILMVLLSHALWIFPVSHSVVSQIFTVFGFLGVELFFVLSGFLIGGILLRIYNSNVFGFTIVLQFLKRRWYRTLPNYYLILIINIIVAVLLQQSMQGTWVYFFFLQNAIHTMPVFFPESWSLSIEEFAYVLLPLCLFGASVIWSDKTKKKQFLTVVLVLMLFFLSTKLYYHYTALHTTLQQWNLSLKAVVLYRIDAVLMGVLFCWIAQQYPVLWRKSKWTAFIMAVLLLLILFVGVGFFQWHIDNNPMFWNVFYLPLNSFALALLLPMLSLWTDTKLAFRKVIEMLSKISYSLYLLHYSIVLQLMKYFFPTENYSFYQLILYAGAYLVVSSVMAYFLYRFFEKPIMDLRDK